MMPLSIFSPFFNQLVVLDEDSIKEPPEKGDDAWHGHGITTLLEVT